MQLIKLENTKDIESKRMLLFLSVSIFVFVLQKKKY